MEINKEKEVKLTEKPDSHVLEESKAGSVDNMPDLGERFQVESLIGTGAMGTVYKAFDLTTSQTVAIKVIKPELAKDAVAVKRFEQEVEATSKLNHENLAAVYMTGQTVDGLPYIVMQYLEGENLSEVIKRSGKLEEKRAIKIFRQICQALASAHDNNILHRDLKPSNIIVAKDSNQLDSCWVVDFGISKIQEATSGSTNALTKTGDIIGSPYYMSPEMCQGESMDERSDIYSLGCLMAEALTGEPLFDGAHSVQVILKHLNEPTIQITKSLKQRGVSKELNSIITACLGKQKELRYKSVHDLIFDLDQVSMGSKPIKARSIVGASTKKGMLISITVLAAIFSIGLMSGFMSIYSNGGSLVTNVSNQTSLKNMKSSLITNGDLRNASQKDKNRIVTLVLQDSRITNSGLRYLKEFRILKGLNLSGTKVGQDGLKELSDLKNLDWLNLKNTRVTDESIKDLAPLNKMRWLYLGNTAIGDDSLKVIGAMPNLKTLCLTKTQISDKGIPYIMNTPLKTLHVVSTRLSDEGFRKISMIPTIESLQLTKTAISDKSLGYISNLENLKSLTAKSTNIGDSGIEKLTKAKKLEVLKVSSTKITDKSLEYLSKLPNLKRLTLGDNNITDAGIVHLAKLKNLNYLDLSSTNISDEALNTISTLPNLNTLLVSTTNVSNAGLLKLANSPHLSHLTVFGCKSVTPEGIKQFRRLKNITIK